MPRIRDFRGLNPKSFDGHGNYAFGIKEQIIFPEINYDRIDKVRGMDIIVTTTARTDEEARELMRLFGFPFPRSAEHTSGIQSLMRISYAAFCLTTTTKHLTRSTINH